MSGVTMARWLMPRQCGASESSWPSLPDCRIARPAAERPSVKSRPEGCESGRIGWSRKPLCLRAPWVQIPLPPPPASNVGWQPVSAAAGPVRRPVVASGRSRARPCSQCSARVVAPGRGTGRPASPSASSPWSSSAAGRIRTFVRKTANPRGGRRRPRPSPRRPRPPDRPVQPTRCSGATTWRRSRGSSTWRSTRSMLANGIESADRIDEGQVLQIPPSTPVTISVTPPSAAANTVFELAVSGALARRGGELHHHLARRWRVRGPATAVPPEGTCRRPTGVRVSRRAPSRSPPRAIAAPPRPHVRRGGLRVSRRLRAARGG